MKEEVQVYSAAADDEFAKQSQSRARQAFVQLRAASARQGARLFVGAPGLQELPLLNGAAAHEPHSNYSLTIIIFSLSHQTSCLLQTSLAPFLRSLFCLAFTEHPPWPLHFALEVQCCDPPRNPSSNGPHTAELDMQAPE